METNCRIGKVTPKGNLVLLPTASNSIEQLTPNKVLISAMGRLSDVVVIGWDNEAQNIYVASNIHEFGNALIRLEQAKDIIMYGHAR